MLLKVSNTYVLSSTGLCQGVTGKSRPSTLTVTTILLLLATNLPTVTSSNNFLPYGPSAGDGTFPKSDDAFEAVDLTVNFPFYGESYNKMYINTDGGITFKGPYTDFDAEIDFPIEDNEKPMIAVYWADAKTHLGGDIYYRQTTDQDILDLATQQIHSKSGCAYSQFTAAWAYIVTWDQIAFFGATEIGVSKRNTFQLVLVVDSSGENSFSIVNYDRLDWTTGTSGSGHEDTGLQGHSALVGFDAGDGTNYKKLPGSKTSSVVDLEDTTNANTPGLWIYKISDRDIPGKW